MADRVLDATNVGPYVMELSVTEGERVEYVGYVVDVTVPGRSWRVAAATIDGVFDALEDMAGADIDVEQLVELQDALEPRKSIAARLLDKLEANQNEGGYDQVAFFRGLLAAVDAIGSALHSERLQAAQMNIAYLRWLDRTEGLSEAEIAAITRNEQQADETRRVLIGITEAIKEAQDEVAKAVRGLQAKRS